MGEKLSQSPTIVFLAERKKKKTLRALEQEIRQPDPQQISLRNIHLLCKDDAFLQHYVAEKLFQRGKEEIAETEKQPHPYRPKKRGVRDARNIIRYIQQKMHLWAIQTAQTGHIEATRLAVDGFCNLERESLSVSQDRSPYSPLELLMELCGQRSAEEKYALACFIVEQMTRCQKHLIAGDFAALVYEELSDGSVLGDRPDFIRAVIGRLAFNGTREAVESLGQILKATAQHATAKTGRPSESPYASEKISLPILPSAHKIALKEIDRLLANHPSPDHPSPVLKHNNLRTLSPNPHSTQAQHRRQNCPPAVRATFTLSVIQGSRKDTDQQAACDHNETLTATRQEPSQLTAVEGPGTDKPGPD